MEIRYRRDLWQLFKDTKTSDLTGVVEVGVAEGNFSEDILNWPVKFPNVYLVDRWTCMPDMKGDSAHPQEWHDANQQRVMERTRKFDTRATLMRMASVDAALKFPSDCLDLVYVDGDHSFSGVVADLAAWYPKVKQGGYMAFHDFENKAYGVKPAVTEWAQRYGLELHLITEDKPEDAGAYFQKC